MLLIELDHDLSELIIVQFNIQMDLLFELPCVVSVVEVFQDFDLFELDEKTQFHFIDVAFTFD